MQRYLVCALLCALSALADAASITIDFDVTSSPLSLNYPAGISGSGQFTFQDSLLPPAGSRVFETEFGLPVTAAKFQWFGKSFDASTVRLYELQTDATGKLISWGIGVPGCGTAAATKNFNAVCSATQFDDFWAAIYDDHNAHAALSSPGINGVADGVGAWHVNSVPEPATLGLLSIGLLFVGCAARIRKNMN